jgi:ABC-2 type transport system ATP-binding protein
MVAAHTNSSGFCLRTSHIRREYVNKIRKKKVVALNDVNVEIAKGEVCGLVGPNGAGKSTLINIVMGIDRPTSGRVELIDARDDFLFGYVPDRPIFYEESSAFNNLLHFARLLDVQQPSVLVDKLLVEFELEERRNDPVSTFSKGMKQRLSIARTLIEEPTILIMDEPFSGLDPSAMLSLREIIIRLKERGLTILLSSHDLNEIDKVCDSIIFIKNGNIVGKQALNAQTNRKFVRISISNPDVLYQMGDDFRVMERKNEGEGWIVEMPVEMIAANLRSLIEKGGIVTEFTPLHKTTEDYYCEKILEEGHETS